MVPPCCGGVPRKQNGDWFLGEGFWDVGVKLLRLIWWTIPETIFVDVEFDRWMPFGDAAVLSVLPVGFIVTICLSWRTITR